MARAGIVPADFDAGAYAVAYRFAYSRGVGHATAVSHAMLVSYRADDRNAVYLCALAAGCKESDARDASRADIARGPW